MISLITTYSLGENDDILEILGLLGRQSDGLGLLFIHLLVNLLIFIDAAVHLFYLFKRKKRVYFFASDDFSFTKKQSKPHSNQTAKGSSLTR